MRVLLIAFLLALIAAPAAAQGAKKLYKWTDEKGNVYYSDKVPPDQVKQGREELNAQGVTTKTVDRALTAEELAEKRAREAEARRLAEEAKRQADEEKRFISAYANEEDLHRSFNQNLELLGQQIASSRADVGLRQKSLDQLLARAAEVERSGKKVDPGLLSMIETERRAIAQQNAYVEQKEAEKAAAEADYQAKLARYRELVAKSKAGSS